MTSGFRIERRRESAPALRADKIYRSRRCASSNGLLRFFASSKTLFDADAVIANSTIGLESRRQQVSEIAAHAKTDCADATIARTVATQKLERRRRVFDGFVFVDLLIKLDRFVPVVAFVGELHAAFDAPEQIRTERDEAVRRVPVSNAAHVAVDAEDLLEHDDAWSITARGQGKVAVELAAVEGFDCDHSGWIVNHRSGAADDADVRARFLLLL